MYRWHCSIPHWLSVSSACAGCTLNALWSCQWRLSALLLNSRRYANQSDVSTSICSLSNSSARVAATRSSPVSSAMCNSLHWLNFPQRVTYKLCLLTNKCLHGLAPDYLTHLCVCTATDHGRPRLRSSDDHQLLIPRTRTVTLGPCAFNTSGPASWNALPAALRDPAAVTLGTFRQMLKPFLFWLTDVFVSQHGPLWRLLRGVWNTCYHSVAR